MTDKPETAAAAYDQTTPLLYIPPPVAIVRPEQLSTYAESTRATELNRERQLINTALASAHQGHRDYVVLAINQQLVSELERNGYNYEPGVVYLNANGQHAFRKDRSNGRRCLVLSMFIFFLLMAGAIAVGIML